MLLASSAALSRRLGRGALIGLAAASLAAGPDAVAADTESPSWPFGEAGGPAGEDLDLFNLGLLGVKVDDAARARPDNAPQASGIRRFAIDREMGDAGADELRVDMLLPKGPAARARLRMDDVLDGVNGQAFSGNSLQLIARALVEAEAGENGGAVTLMVRRAGKGDEADELEIKVKLRKAGPEALHPSEGEGRRHILDEALAWLAKHQEGGGYPQTFSGMNGAVVATSVAGLAWLGGGSDARRGKYAKNVRAAADFVASNLTATEEPEERTPGGASMDQSNWAYSFAAIFLGELQARDPSAATQKVLFECADHLVKRQEKSGGWAHGGGGTNPLGYLELNIVTALSLTGLGLAHQAGYEVPRSTIDRAHDYLDRCIASDGSVSYSADPRQVGRGNVGRTAGCWLGVVLLGGAKHPHAQKMERYLTEHVGDVLGGHASIMIHTLLAGVAAEAIGGEARTRYWEQLERDLTLARAPDGSLQPRRWFESIGAESNADVNFGEVWTTAAWAVVLGSQVNEERDTGLPALLGVGLRSVLGDETPR